MGAHRAFELAVSGFVALIPLQNIYLQYVPNLGGGLNFLNVMLIVSLLGAWRCGGSTVPGTGVNGWMMAYMLYSCIALVIGIGMVADTSGHASMLKDHLIAVAFLFLAQMSAIDRAGVRRLFLASLVPLPYIAWVISTQLAWASSWHYSHDLRVRGTFMELGANEIGAFCVTVLMMTGGLLLAARTSLYWKIALAVGFGLAAYGIVSSYSRTAYIASIAGLALIVLFPPGRMRRLLPFLAVSALVLALRRRRRWSASTASRWKPASATRARRIASCSGKWQRPGSANARSSVPALQRFRAPRSIPTRPTPTTSSCVNSWKRD